MIQLWDGKILVYEYCNGNWKQNMWRQFLKVITVLGGVLIVKK